MSHSAAASGKPTEGAGPAPAAAQDLYRLLGLSPFEPNPAIISSRVRELMRETRKYQLGLYAARTQSRMEELAAATACLLDPRRKQVYDEDLRRQYGMPPISVTSTYTAPILESLPVDPAFVRGARKSGGWQRTALVILAIAAVALVVRGFRLHAPTRPIRSTPVAKPSNADSSSAGPGGVAGSATGAAAAGKTITAIPKGRSNPVDRSAPTTVPPKGGAARRPARSAEAEAVVATLREIASAGSAIAPSDKGAIERPETKASREKRAGTSPTVVQPPDARRAPVSQPTRRLGDVRRPSGAGALPPSQKAPAESGMHLTPGEVLHELRDIRLKRTPALRVSPYSRSLGAERVIELVKYARATFADDRHFQRQLDQEVAAIKRVYPQLRDALSDPPH